MTRQILYCPKTLLLIAAITLAIPASAAPPSPAKCQGDRWVAAGKYNFCQQKTLGKNFLGAVISPERSFWRCRSKYASRWRRLEVNCGPTRFIDNGDGTLSDDLTGLQWERKTSLNGASNPSDPHDADNTYTWSTGGAYAADGTVHTDFIAALNTPPCLGGQCDWRLPTFWELQTTMDLSLPCTSSPCTVGEFIPTALGLYWSSTPIESLPANVTPNPHLRGIHFAGGSLVPALRDSPAYARAVRGGL